MTQLVICSSCNKHYDSVMNEKPNAVIKHVMTVGMLESKELESTLAKPKNNEDNISIKSSTQDSQSSNSNTSEIIANNINTIQFFTIGNDNDNMNERRRPTIHERLNHIHISLDEIKNKIENNKTMQTTNEDIELLKSRTDNIELMLENQSKLTSDIGASIKHCIHQMYCNL